MSSINLTKIMMGITTHVKYVGKNNVANVMLKIGKKLGSNVGNTMLKILNILGKSIGVKKRLLNRFKDGETKTLKNIKLIIPLVMHSQETLLKRKSRVKFAILKQNCMLTIKIIQNHWRSYGFVHSAIQKYTTKGSNFQGEITICPK